MRVKEKPVVLIVDDQEQNVELLEAFLLPFGYKILTAASGEEALERLAGNSVDLLLLDVRMPGMDGYEVCRRIRADAAHRKLPIIMVTALQDAEDRRMGSEAGCDDFISKPIDKKALFGRVKAMLEVYTTE